MVAAASYEGIIETVSEPAFRLTSIQSDAIDLVYSNAVLEHVHPLEEAIGEFYRVTSPGGFGAHQIDFRYHRNFDLPLEHLLFTEEEYAKILAATHCETGCQTRVKDAAEMFRKAGFDVVKIDVNMTASKACIRDFLPRLRRSTVSTYRNWAADELAKLGARIFVRKPAHWTLAVATGKFNEVTHEKYAKSMRVSRKQIIIDLTGEVVPCCFWSGYGNFGKPLGNTNANTIDEIWRGEAYRDLRAKMASGNLSDHPSKSCMAYRCTNGTFPKFSWPAGFCRGEWLLLHGGKFLKNSPEQPPTRPILFDCTKTTLSCPFRMRCTTTFAGRAKAAIQSGTVGSTSLRQTTPIPSARVGGIGSFAARFKRIWVIS